jgi:hypothetical protein
VARDPRGGLQVRGRVTEHDDLLGAFGDLPDGEDRRDRDGGRDRPPGDGFAGLGGFGAEAGPAGGLLAQREVAQAQGQRGEHEHQRRGGEPSREQQGQAGQQPRGGQQRGDDGDRAEHAGGYAAGDRYVLGFLLRGLLLRLEGMAGRGGGSGRPDRHRLVVGRVGRAVSAAGSLKDLSNLTDLRGSRFVPHETTLGHLAARARQ